jgi:CHAT domain-containing protein
MGYYDRALAKLDYLLELDKISIWLNMGSNYAEQGNYIKAEELFRRALEISIDLKIGDLTQVCYQNLAEFYTDQGLDSVAADNYAISIETAESIRGKLEVEGQKTTYSSGISGLYSKMVLSLLRLDRNEDAYNYVERSRARSFLDLLASGEVKVGKSRHEEFLEKEEESQDKEEEIEGQLIAAEEDTVLYASLRGKLEEQRGLSAVEMKEKKEYEPELASLVTVNSLTLSEVQALLDKETVLEYFLTDEKTLIWLITKDNAEVYQVDIGGDSLKVMVEDYRSSIAKLSDIDEQSSAFYNLLIAPAVKKIETEKLVIIPHGILHYLPFQALQDEKGKYLLEKYQISYLPSASMMKYIIPKKRRKGKKVLALGNPKLDNPGYASITFAEKEVKAISKQYRKSKIFIGEDATEDNFRELAPDYDILHLACHAELNSAYPLFSGLLLSSNEEHDGELDVHELFTMDLNAYLVVLSACQTGLGHLTNGDELVGLSRAFIYAGTPSIISSLWMVEDESTSFLMERFYTHLQKKNKAKSLRMAQLETKEKYEHPLYWAPFVLVGDSE